MKTNKRIGIPGYKFQDSSYGVGPFHLEFVSQFGIPRIIMPDEELADVDMLYLTGGLDLNPSSYGEVPGFKTSNIDVFKQFFYDNRLKNYVGRMPIFGVCLGAQELAVYFGSKLIQNLPFHPQSNRGEDAHNIILLDDRGNPIRVKKFNKTQQKDILVNLEQPVNSHHHQGIPIETLSAELQPMGIYNDFSGVLVEAFKHRLLPIAAVQYHPEEYYNPLAEEMFNELIQTINVEEHA